MGLWLAALVVLTAALMWALRREHRRLEREARIAALLEPMQRAWIDFQIVMVDQLTPALMRVAQAARDMEPAMKRLAAIWGDAGDGAGGER